MEVNIRGKNVTLTERFEQYVATRVEKLTSLLPKAQTLEIHVSRQSDRSPQNGDRVEITLVGPGPVIRAESSAHDKYSAFDIAYGRLLERVRRLKDRKKSHRGRGRIALNEAAAQDFSMIDVVPVSSDVLDTVTTGETSETETPIEAEYTPVVIRAKEFVAERLTVDEAVDQMELVGHDFFLFLETESGKPSVVYRRKGWNYGVISLADAE